MPEPAQNPLVPVVTPIPAAGRRALYAAANAGALRRGTWKGCALNRAGADLGLSLSSYQEAASALKTTPDTIRRFVSVWDNLSGTNRYCTQLLRNALEHAGFFDDGDEPDALVVTPGSSALVGAPTAAPVPG